MADLNEKLSELTNTEDTTAEFDAEDIKQNKAMAILAYISWLVLVPIFGAKESKFARFHANQGLVLAIAEIICWVVLGILTLIPFLGILFLIIEWLLNILFLAFAIIGIINACNGKAKELPFVGKFRLLK